VQTITGTTHTLPFAKLAPGDFERLCLWLVRREGYERAEHLGAAGSEQGRDIIAWREGRQWAFQCKRVQDFGPKDALVEIDKVLALPQDQRPAEYVFIITRNVSANTRQQARDRCADQIGCHFWAGTELDEMVKRHPDIVREFFQLDDLEQGGFQAGERLKKLRQELSLKPSEFMEILGLASETRYRTMEAGESECSRSLLETVCAVSGVSLEWLKHGTEPEHAVDLLYWPRVSEAIQILVDLSPESVYVTYEQKNLHVGLCAQTDKFIYQVYDLNLSMDFWKWDEAFGYIPYFFAFLHSLQKTFDHRVCGRRISPKNRRRLYGGKAHPYSIVPPGMPKFHYWVDDVLDIWHKRLNAEDYSRMYGKWFPRVQQECRKHKTKIEEIIGEEIWR